MENKKSTVHLMIVEDERIIAADLEERLIDLGYYICARVSSGESAVTKCQTERPDLILMDIKLEGTMDGIEAAKVIKEKWDIPVVFMTAYSDEKMLDRGKLSEPFGYLVKPYRIKDLYATIEMALYKAKSEKGIRDTKNELEQKVEELAVANDQLTRISDELREKNRSLELAHKEIKILSGFLPICAHCKQIRDDDGYWNQIEVYIRDHSEAQFTHGVCPKCAKKHYPEIDINADD